MKTIFHSANSRGETNLGWLRSKHSFSFGEYYNPERISFGALRVLNDDIVNGGMGFDTHPHKNMEIISIPLKGALAHKDNKGHSGIIKENDVQVMSAGARIMHSEYNASTNEEVHFLQLWIVPDQKDVVPRYDQRTYPPASQINGFQLLVAPINSNPDALEIHQNAYISRATIKKGDKLSYKPYNDANQVYFFLIKGDIIADNTELKTGDGLGLINPGTPVLMASDFSEALAIEVPTK